MFIKFNKKPLKKSHVQHSKESLRYKSLLNDCSKKVLNKRQRSEVTMSIRGIPLDTITQLVETQLTLYRPYAPYDVFLQFPQTTVCAIWRILHTA